MTPTEVARLLVEIGAIEVRVDPDEWFTWSSGRRAPIYCDNRIVISYPQVRARFATALADSIGERFPGVEVIAGTATAGIPHAAGVADRLSLPMVYVRGEAKGHGQQKRVEGRPLQGERVVVLEDLISFGGSSLSAVDGVGEEGGKVIGVQSIFTYGFPETVRRFEAAHVPWQALSSFDALLETLDLTPDQARVLLDWRGR